MNTNEEPLGREEDDGTRGCCEHGVPAMCECKQCSKETGQALLAPARCSASPEQPAHILREAIQAMEQEQYDDYCEYVRMCGGTPISKIPASRPVTPNDQADRSQPR